MAITEKRLDEIANQASSASTRSRNIILLTVFASIVAFSAYWNSRPGSWPHARYKLLNEAAEIILYKNDPTKLIHLPDGKAIAQAFAESDDYNEHYTEITHTEDEIISFLKKRKINTIGEFTALQDVYFNLYESTYTVRIPVLGISFDVNDLGLFTGLTLSLLLALLWFCLEREWENLSIVFKDAIHFHALEHYYKLLSMSQVLTVPGKPNHDVSLLWIILPKFLYLIPLAIQVMISLNDLGTSNVITPISEDATAIYNFTNKLFMGIILILTIVALIYVIKIDLVWARYHKILSSDKNDEPSSRNHLEDQKSNNFSVPV